MLQKEIGDVIQWIIGDMIVEFEKVGVEVDVFGCVKKFYLIWWKMQEKEQSFLCLFDIYGFWIIIKFEEDCYRVLGVIYQCWVVVSGCFKDYISQLKFNGYCLIYIMVFGCNVCRVEVQICIQKMYDVVEIGVVVYWFYCDGVCGENFFVVDFVCWIWFLIEQFNIEEDYDEFMEVVKLEMYLDQVFCFIFKGDVVKFFCGVILIDFVYVIYMWIGNVIVGVKIDYMCVLFWMWVKNGQFIEIIIVEG